MTRWLRLALLAIGLAGAAVPGAEAWAQAIDEPVVNDPAPEDLDPIDLPPVVDVPVTAPGASPAIASSGGVVPSRDAVKTDAKAFATDVLQGYLDVPKSQNSASMVPGYTGETLPETQLYSNPAQLESEGMTRSASDPNYRFVTDAARPRMTVSRDQIAGALAVEADPRAFLQGTTLDGAAGTCKQLEPGTKQDMAEFTCNVGASVDTRDVSCRVTLDHHFSSSNRYSCTSLVEKGTFCAQDYLVDGKCYSRVGYSNQIGSGCGAFRAAGSGCSLVSSAQTLLGPAYDSTYDGFLGKVYLTSSVYQCGSPVGGTIEGSGYTMADGTQIEPTFSFADGGLAYLGSTQNLSQCEAASNLACPSGYVLEGPSCVKRVPATITYACEEGWSLSGDQCVRTQYADGTISGYACPSGYTLNGTQCESRVDATIAGHTCPGGFTLNGTQCEQVLTQAATVASLTCPAGYTQSGTDCTLTESVAGTPVYSCPAGWTLAGSSCTLNETQPPSTTMTCEPGWTLNGDVCTRQTTQAANVSGYDCEAGWTATGSSCVRTTTTAATPNYSCPAGWALVGSQCTQSSTTPASPSYSCPSGTTLSGDQCVSTASQSPTTTYSCASGWSLSGTTCTLDTNRPADVIYYCTAPAVLSGAICETTTSVAPTLGYDCQGLTYLATTGLCRLRVPAYEGGCGDWGDLVLVDEVYLDKIGDSICYYQPITTRTCPSGYTDNGSTCVMVSESPAPSYYGCQAGETLSGSTCSGSQTSYATPVYSCPDGTTLSGDLCVSGASQPASVSYSCPAESELSGSSCVSTVSETASVSYSCPYGYTQIGSQCSLTETIPAAPSYSCPVGSTLSGSTCYGTESMPADPVYGCPDGWSVDQAMCYRVTTSAATLAYDCPAGYTASGGMCTRTTSVAGTPQYSCPSGYTLEGSSCSRTVVEGATPNYSCPTDHTLLGTVCSSTVSATISGYDCPAGYTRQGQSCYLSTSMSASAVPSCENGFALSDGQCVSFSDPAPVGDQCSTPIEQCVESDPVTRIINGVPVTQPCWAWDRSYTCSSAVTGKTDCQSLETNTSCHLDREICIDDVEAPVTPDCRTIERIYMCPTGSTTKQPAEYVCGDDVYCIDGDCEPIEREASNEFKDAVVGLNALGQVNAEFDEQSLTLFRGERLTCSKKVFGISNCCSGKGVPLLTPWLCSSADRDLDKRDDAGLCHKVGTYCSSKVLGICVTRKDAACCFASKLTRIIQEQGRVQINKPWGNPKTEQCLGFTYDEFALLDLSQMDFSEVYAEFMEAAKLPDEMSLATQIQQRIQEYYAARTGK